jgi:hypothetical protein
MFVNRRTTRCAPIRLFLSRVHMTNVWEFVVIILSTQSTMFCRRAQLCSFIILSVDGVKQVPWSAL